MKKKIIVVIFTLGLLIMQLPLTASATEKTLSGKVYNVTVNRIAAGYDTITLSDLNLTIDGVETSLATDYRVDFGGMIRPDVRTFFFSCTEGVIIVDADASYLAPAPTPNATVSGPEIVGSTIPLLTIVTNFLMANILLSIFIGLAISITVMDTSINIFNRIKTFAKH